jgi:hypothetical protein
LEEELEMQAVYRGIDDPEDASGQHLQVHRCIDEEMQVAMQRLAVC